MRSLANNAVVPLRLYSYIFKFDKIYTYKDISKGKYTR